MPQLTLFPVSRLKATHEESVSHAVAAEAMVCPLPPHDPIDQPAGEEDEEEEPHTQPMGTPLPPVQACTIDTFQPDPPWGPGAYKRKLLVIITPS